MKHTLTIAGLTIQDLLRRKTLYMFLAIILLFAGIMSVSLFTMSKLSPGADGSELRDMRAQVIVGAYGVLWSLGGFALAILAFVALSSEITQGTAVMLLSKTVTRVELFSGKFTGLLALVLAYSGFATTAVLCLSYLLEGSVDRLLWRASLDGLLSTLITVSSAFLFISWMSLVPAVSAWLAFTFLQAPVVFFSQGGITVVSTVARALRHLFDASHLFNSLSLYSQQAPVVAASAWDVWLPILHAVDYSALLLIAGAWLFSRRSLLVR